MSENRRNRTSGYPKDNTPAESGNSRNNSRYEGFEGMNYEQVRQPYQFKSAERKRNVPETKKDSK